MNKTIIAPQVSGFITNFIRKNKTAVATPPVLKAAIRMPYAPFKFVASLTVGCPFEIQASPDLRHWTPISYGTADHDLLQYVDPDASKFSSRFYRAICGAMASSNLIGYATQTLPPGFSMVANPLRASDNSIAALFPNMPEATTLCKFDPHLFRLNNNAVKNGHWTKPDEELLPGEGAIVFNPTNNFKTVNFSGEFVQGQLVNPIPAGLSIRSSLVPQAGRLHSDLGLAMAEGDAIHLFDRDQQKYVVHPFSAKEWEINEPAVAVGEAFWIGKTNPGNWVRQFEVS
ncbi:MAG: hypothetical protein ABIP71_12760 [Verrucomicrobiota bacterium]